MSVHHDEGCAQGHSVSVHHDEGSAQGPSVSVHHDEGSAQGLQKSKGCMYRLMCSGGILIMESLKCSASIIKLTFAM